MLRPTHEFCFLNGKALKSATELDNEKWIEVLLLTSFYFMDFGCCGVAPKIRKKNVSSVYLVSKMAKICILFNIRFDITFSTKRDYCTTIKCVCEF